MVSVTHSLSADRMANLCGKVAGSSAVCLLEIQAVPDGFQLLFKAPSSVLCRLMADATKILK